MVRKHFVREFADKIIEDLEKGTAPWIKPWKPGELHAPFNPISGTVYQGINNVMLMREGHEDPRFMTLKQANQEDWKVKKGAKSRPIVFFKFTEEQLAVDEDGKPVLDENGKQVMETVFVERPKTLFYSVFHASQIDGIPEWKGRELTWDPNERAETILTNSGADIRHSQRDRAFYRMSSDQIHLPPKQGFDAADKYYSTALHELGHWTRHPSRLNRDSGPFGSEEYAKEELRAEISSWMTGMELGVGHDPGQHLSYVDSWVKILKDQPYELLRACRDAEKIKQYTLAFEKTKSKEASVSQEKSQEQQNKQTRTPEVSLSGAQNNQQHNMAPAPGTPPRKNAEPQKAAPEKTWLQVPYKEKNQAKKLGARWDRTAKCWYAPQGTDLAPLKRWIPRTIGTQQSVSNSPVHDFAQALRESGLDLRGELPVMDGQLHRVPLLDGKPGSRDGAYKGYLDGVPAGFIQNHKTGLKTNWKSNGHTLSAEQKAALSAEAAMKKARREAETKERNQQAAKRAYGIWKNAKEVPSNQPYLKAKGVQAHGLKSNDRGDLLVPARDEKGFLHSLQVIGPDGKRFLKDGRQGGTFHCIDPGNALRNPNVTLLIAEGYATAATLNECTGMPVLAAFNAGNLETVARAIHRENPKRSLAIMADNDHHLKENVGLQKAQKAAKAVNAIMIAPAFTREEMNQGLTDFNDLAASRGWQEVKQQVMPLLRKAHEAKLAAERTQKQNNDMNMAM